MHYVHDLDPIAFNLFGLAFPWYWLSYLLGFFWVMIQGHHLTKKYSHLKLKFFWQHLQWGWPALFIGSRVFYVFIYNWEFFKDHPELIPQIWLGGMSFHGALLGILISSFLVSYYQRSNFFSLTDIIATCAPLPLFFGRITNFINGELAGKPTEVAWAVIFPRLYDDLPRHPSQLYQAFTEGLLLFIILNLTAKKTLQKPGLQSAYFLIGYGSFRFLTEFFRLPDPQIGALTFGLSLGQYLCLIMILSGALLWRKSLKARF